MQLTLPMLTVYDGPRLIDRLIVDSLLSYREAVRACWNLRTRRNLTYRLLAEEAGLYASHASEYFSADGAKRELPAKHIAAVEVALGNRVISQYQAKRAGLTIMEEFMQHRRSAA